MNKIKEIVFIHWINNLSNKEIIPITGNIESNPRYSFINKYIYQIIDQLTSKSKQKHNIKLIEQKIYKLLFINLLIFNETNYSEFKNKFSQLSILYKFKIFLKLFFNILYNKFNFVFISYITQLKMGSYNENLFIISRKIDFSKTSGIHVFNFLNKLLENNKKNILIYSSGSFKYQKKYGSTKKIKKINFIFSNRKICLKNTNFFYLSENFKYYFNLMIKNYINESFNYNLFANELIKNRPNKILVLSNDYYLSDSVNYFAKKNNIKTIKYLNTLDLGISYFYTSAEHTIVPSYYSKLKLERIFTNKKFESIGSLELFYSYNKIYNSYRANHSKNLLIISKGPEEHYYNDELLKKIINSSYLPSNCNIIIRGKLDILSKKNNLKNFSNINKDSNISLSKNQLLIDDIIDSDYIICATGGAFYTALISGKPVLLYCFDKKVSHGYDDINTLKELGLKNEFKKISNLNEVDSMLIKLFDSYLGNPKIQKEVLFRMIGSLEDVDNKIIKKFR